MAWEIEITNECRDWYEDLPLEDQDKIRPVVDKLTERGPALGRPLVGEVQESRNHNLKELIPPASNIRILFLFDPRRHAILLVGGDKTGEWGEWYDRMIPVADRLYDEYLEELRKEGTIK